MKYKLLHNLPHDPTTCLGWLLDARGIENTEDYVYPIKRDELNPMDLDNIKEGVNLLLWHLKNNSEILLVVDSDTDGVCSASMMWLYIKHFYPNAKISYVSHEHKAHGLDDIIGWVLESDYNLIICPDASSSDYEEHRLLKEAGKEVLVIDHHEADKYSENAVVINNQLSKNYKNKNLCGAGVVYKFLQVLDTLLEENYSLELLDLCALANIADCMSPSNLETRYYISEGLKPSNIKNGGFRALIQA